MRVTIRQIGGDDGHQWCVMVDGRVKWDGMTRAEAKWRRDREIAAIDEAAPAKCKWFALCDNPATATAAHPILGAVPICARCAAKLARLTADAGR
jgi:hypothetical protein